MSKGRTIGAASLIVHVLSIVFVYYGVWDGDSTCPVHDNVSDFATAVVGFTLAEMAASWWTFSDEEAARSKNGWYIFKVAIFVMTNILGTAAVAAAWALAHYSCTDKPAWWLLIAFVIRLLEPALGHYMALETLG